MKTHISLSQDYVCTAEVRPLELLSGNYHFELTSRWSGAKNPMAEQRMVKLTLDAQALRQLRDLINTALSQ